MFNCDVNGDNVHYIVEPLFSTVRAEDMIKKIQNVFFSKRFLSKAILLLFGTLVAFYVVSNWSEFASLELVKPEFILLMVTMVLVNLYSTGRGMDAVLRPLGLTLGKFETFGLASVTRLGNQIAPGKLGLATRATYLKRTYRLPLTQFASTLAAAQILTYLVSSVLGLGAIIMLRQSSYAPQLILFVLLLSGMIIALLCLLLLSPKIKERNNKIYNHLAKAINGWHTIRHDRSALLSSSFWIIINVLSQAIVVFAAFNVFNVDVSMAQSIFITSIRAFGAIIAITPGGLGINEGLVVLSATAVGIPVSLILSSVLLRRIVTLVTSFVATLLSARKLFGKSVFQMLRHQKINNE